MWSLPLIEPFSGQPFRLGKGNAIIYGGANIFVGGSATDWFDRCKDSFGVGFLGSNIWVQAFDDSGNPLWWNPVIFSKEAENCWNEQALDVAVDRDANILVLGSGWSNVADENGVEPGYRWLNKYSPDGESLWPEPLLFRDGDHRFSKIAINLSGEMYVAGGSVLKFDSEGSAIWPAPLTVNGVAIRDIAVNSEDNIYVTGSSTFGGGEEIWTNKYDGEGNPLWNEPATFRWGIQNIGQAIDLDQNGNVYVAGEIRPPQTAPTNLTDVWINKYDPDGNPLWEEPITFSTPGDFMDLVNDIVVEPRSGDFIFVGGALEDGFQLRLHKYTCTGGSAPVE